MNHFMKKFISCAFVFATLGITACSGSSYTLPQEFSERKIEDSGKAAYTDTVNASGIERTAGGKQYLVSNGRPVMMLGAQL